MQKFKFLGVIFRKCKSISPNYANRDYFSNLYISAKEIKELDYYYYATNDCCFVYNDKLVKVASIVPFKIDKKIKLLISGQIVKDMRLTQVFLIILLKYQRMKKTLINIYFLQKRDLRNINILHKRKNFNYVYCS